MRSSVVEFANGIRRVSTPSHGGYWVPAKLLRFIPARYQAYATKWSGSPQWYEEDCAWACIAVTFPDAFDWSAADTLRRAEMVREAIHSALECTACVLDMEIHLTRMFELLGHLTKTSL